MNRLAEEAGVSPFHFVRLFREAMGVTPRRYLTKTRMEAAASLLADTDLSILDIALECGYQSQSHFSTAFQQHFSCPPSRYR